MGHQKVKSFCRPADKVLIRMFGQFQKVKRPVDFPYRLPQLFQQAGAMTSQSINRTQNNPVAAMTSSRVLIYKAFINGDSRQPREILLVISRQISPKQTVLFISYQSRLKTYLSVIYALNWSKQDIMVNAGMIANDIGLHYVGIRNEISERVLCTAFFAPPWSAM